MGSALQKKKQMFFGACSNVWSVLKWTALFVALGTVTPAFYSALKAHMPDDGAGFLFHYSTLLSVLVAALALGIPHFEHYLDRKRADHWIQEYEDCERDFDFNGFSSIPEIMLDAVRYAAELSRDKVLIEKASTAKQAHHKRVEDWFQMEAERHARIQAAALLATSPGRPEP